MSLNLNLNLKKPLVFIKVATTGKYPIVKKDSQGPADRIIEISITKINTDRSVQTGTKLVNPEIPIPEEATRLNGITNEMVANSPNFQGIASNLFSFIGDSDLAGFSLTNFDLRFLTEEFNRAGIPFTTVGRKIIDLSSIYLQKERRDFRAAVERFNGTQLTSDPISSETANIQTIQILNGMVSAYQDDERFQSPTPASLHENFNKNKRSLDVNGKIVLNKDGRPVFSFGKYKNHLVGDMLLADPTYYDWCVNVSELPADTKLLLTKILEKAKAAQSQQQA